VKKELRRKMTLSLYSWRIHLIRELTLCLYFHDYNATQKLANGNTLYDLRPVAAQSVKLTAAVIWIALIFCFNTVSEIALDPLQLRRGLQDNP
jgi:hypothetical protein